jgi:hypothetical protein
MEFIEELERETLRQIVQAVQELSLYSKRLFDTTPIPASGRDRDAHISQMGEHLVRRAIDRAEVARIDDFYEGEFDSRRVRWMPTNYGTIAQDLRVDAKASTETSRIRLSAYQFPMEAEVLKQGGTAPADVVRLRRIIEPHTILRPRRIPAALGAGARTRPIAAITTAVFIHLHYKTPQQLRSIFVVAAPHQSLRRRYNPSWRINHLWGVGPGPTDPRAVRLNLSRLRGNPFSPWRVQRLVYADPTAITFTEPVWVDRDAIGAVVAAPFDFVPA